MNVKIYIDEFGWIYCNFPSTKEYVYYPNFKPKFSLDRTCEIWNNILELRKFVLLMHIPYKNLQIKNDYLPITTPSIKQCFKDVLI